VADTSNRPGRVRHQSCENVCRYVGLLLWLNSQQPITLSLEHKTTLIGGSPLGAVVETVNPSSHSIIPGPAASILICVIIRHMIKEIGDTSPVTTVSLLPDWDPDRLTKHTSSKPQGNAVAMTRAKFSPSAEMSFDSLKRLAGLDDTSTRARPVTDCQGQSGPESDISAEEGGEGNPEAPTPDEPCAQRCMRKERLGEMEVSLPPTEWLGQDLEWKQILKIGPGLNNFDNTCFCNAVL